MHVYRLVVYLSELANIFYINISYMNHFVLTFLMSLLLLYGWYFLLVLSIPDANPSKRVYSLSFSS